MAQKLTILIAFSFLIVAGSAQDQPETKKEVLDETSGCTTNSKEIINSQEAEFVEIFLKSGIEGDFVGTFGTTVHECLHGYDGDLGEGLEWNDDTYPIAYFVDKGIVIRFPGRRLFKTEELHKNFFSKDIQNLFRYGTYVYADSGPSTATSNQWGIYGLLEEFNAYYHDVRAQIEYFSCSSYSGPADETFGNSMHAYFEFNIFMASYLKYAKTNQKADYEYMMDNKELRLAYTLIEYNWRNLLTEIMSDQNIAKRMPSYDEEFRLFDNELKGIMTDFMIKGDALKDYQTFVDSRPFNMAKVEENKDWAEQLNLSGFGAGMDVDEMTDMYSGMGEIELEFEEKDPEKYYVVILTTKSEEELMNTIFTNYNNYKKMGIIMDYELNFSIYVDKFNSRSKAEKLANEIKKNFPDVIVI